MESMDNTEMESAEWQGEYNESYPDYNEAMWSEARRRSPPPPVRTAPRQSAYTPRPSGPAGYVTQAQLQAALARVNAQMTTNSNAIRMVDGRVRQVIGEQGRQSAALRREVADRRRETEGLRRDLQFTRELSAVIPLIQAANPRIGSVLSLAHLLPSDFLGGYGGGGGGGGGTTGSGAFGGNNLVAIGVIAATLLR